MVFDALSSVPASDSSNKTSSQRPDLRNLARSLFVEHEPAELPEKREGDLRLVTLNVAHGRKRGPHQVLQPKVKLESNLRQVAEALREAEPDIVALQEADGPSSWSGNFDHVEAIARWSDIPNYFRGEHHQVEMGKLKLDYGTALLSQRPLARTESWSFAQAWRDTKGFVVGTVEVPEWDGLAVDVISVHLDFIGPHIRRRQVRRMVDELAHRPNPRILLGDLNCSYLEDPKTIDLVVRELGVRPCHDSQSPTFPSVRPWRRLDWILVSEELHFADEHLTLPHQVSDHLAVVADVRLRK